MKLRPKIVSYMLIVASVPLVLAMSVALRQSSNQTHALSLDIVQQAIFDDIIKHCVFMFEPASLKFFYVNQGAIEQVGHSESTLMNMTPCDIKPEISEQEFRNMIDPLISGKQPSLNFETIHRHKNGTRIPVEIFLQYINPPGESPRFVAIVRDVSERREATRRLNATIDEMAHRTKEITLLAESVHTRHGSHHPVRRDFGIS